MNNLSDSLLETFTLMMISREFSPGDRRIIADTWKKQVLKLYEDRGLTISNKHSNDEILSRAVEETLRNIAKCDKKEKPPT